MKRIKGTGSLLGCVLVLILSSLPACAQETLEFTALLSGANETVPNGSVFIGFGNFSLDGNILSFDVSVEDTNQVVVPLDNGPSGLTAPFQITINGPAGAGQLGPLLPFSNFPTVTDSGGTGAEWIDQGEPLTQPEINQLLAGLWYVNVTTGNYPAGELRGQILPVPEPGTWALLGLGAMVFCFLLGRNKARKSIPFLAPKARHARNTPRAEGPQYDSPGWSAPRGAPG
jgi:CHRD domain/PEP-CTERM motif